jgi:hypothetical protein
VSAGYEAFYLTRWVIFLIRLALSYGYGILQFIAKPGSRYLVPGAIAVLGYLNLSWLQGIVADAFESYENGSTPQVVSLVERHVQRAYYGYTTEPWKLDLALIILFLLACFAYVLLSRALTVVLGAFPQVARPLRPLRRLQPTNQKITSAVVQLAVPKLRR